MTCETCRFHNHVDVNALTPEGLHRCQRYPPVVFRIDDCVTDEYFPEVRPFDWCGEHQPKPTREPPHDM